MFASTLRSTSSRASPHNLYGDRIFAPLFPLRVTPSPPTLHHFCIQATRAGRCSFSRIDVAPRRPTTRFSPPPLPSRSSFFLARLPPDLRGGSNNFRRFYLPGISPRSRTTVVNPRRDVSRLRSPLVLSPPRHLFFIFLLSDPRRDDARSLFAKQPTVFLLRCANRYATTRTTFLQYVRTYVHTDIYPAAMSRVSAICTDR